MTKAPEQSFPNSYYTLIGLMYGRGNLLGANESCIALYFLSSEYYFIETIKGMLPYYSSHRQVTSPKFKDGKLEGLYFPRRIGKEIKREFGITKEDLKNRKIPEIILNSEKENLYKFISGWMSVNSKVEMKGLLNRRPQIIFNDSSIDLIRKFAQILKEEGIEAEIKDNSSKKYTAFNHEFTKASQLIIDKDDVIRFEKTFDMLDPGKSCFLH